MIAVAMTVGAADIDSLTCADSSREQEGVEVHH